MSATRKTKPDTDGPNEADYYPTPAWAVDAIVPHVLADLRLCGRPFLFDPGAGDGAILSGFLRADVDPFHLCGCELRNEATKRCHDLGLMVSTRDWLACPIRWDLKNVGVVVMNPPYGGRTNLAQQFVAAALERVNPGASVWALLRLNWLLDGEALHGRQTWLRQGPGAPDVFALNRRPSFTGDGKADATTYAWMRWVVGAPKEVSTFRALDCHRVERPS